MRLADLNSILVELVREDRIKISGEMVSLINEEKIKKRAGGSSGDEVRSKAMLRQSGFLVLP